MPMVIQLVDADGKAVPHAPRYYNWCFDIQSNYVVYTADYKPELYSGKYSLVKDTIFLEPNHVTGEDGIFYRKYQRDIASEPREGKENG